MLLKHVVIKFPTSSQLWFKCNGATVLIHCPEASWEIE